MTVQLAVRAITYFFKESEKLTNRGRFVVLALSDFVLLFLPPNLEHE